MSQKYLQEEFDKFIKSVFGKVTNQQYTDIRRTFFAGAFSIYNTIMTKLETGQEATEADIALMESLQLELANFIIEVKAEVS